jgi:eukaryotic-like serine/threonine-protein kinase
MNKLILFAFMTIISISILSVAANNPIIIIHQQNVLAQINNISFKTYVNSIYGILMQYPSDWKKVEPGHFSQTNNFNIIVGYLSPKESALYRSPPAALSVGIQNLLNSQSITLDQYSDAQINFIRKQASVLESNTITLKGDNNTRAHKLVYINSEGQKIMQVWTIKDDKAYHITYATNETRYYDYLPPVQRMIDSFEILYS